MPKRHLRLKLACIVTGLLGGLLVAGVTVYLIPPKYESSAIAQIFPPQSLEAGQPKFLSIDLAAEAAALTSDHNLLKVIENLELTERWNADTSQCLESLKEVVRTEAIRGTDLVRITCRHTHKVDARNIAEEVIEARRQQLKQSEPPAASITCHETPVIASNPLREDMGIGLFAGILGGLIVGILLARFAVPRAAADNQHPPDDGPTNEWTTPEMASKLRA